MDTMRAFISETTTPLNIETSIFENVLRNKITASRVYEERQGSLNYNFYPPVAGAISSPFEQGENEGIVMTAFRPEDILAIDEGTVTDVYWSDKYGNVIQIQHSDNMISKYAYLFQTSKNIGDKVIAGEVIGFVGNDELNSNNNPINYKLYFELWHNGNRVNPQNYIVF